MIGFNDYYNAIDEIKSFLARDLIGPVEKNEVIESVEPLSYYVMGILWAKRLNNSTNPIESIDDEELEDLVHTDNDSISDANTYKPPTMGISVMLPQTTKRLEVEFSFGKYNFSTIEKPAEIEGKNPVKINYYTRTPHKLNTVFIVPNKCTSVNCDNHNVYHEFGVDFSLCVRKIMEDGRKLVTITVSNALASPQQSVQQNEAAMLQCNLQIHCSEGFVPVYKNSLAANNEDERISSMQYRNMLNYAYGHGCSVKYNDSGLITTIESDFIPTERVLQMMPGKIKEGEILQLNFWNSANRNNACDCLERFIDEYVEWKSEQVMLTDSFDEYKTVAESVINRIEVCIKRLRQGVAVLRSNEHAWTAFLLMNEAMLLQRKKTKKLNEDELNDVKWYTFQLAYILQIIPDITEESLHRDVVDLLWFPTGGGKTEAYLGVAAFVIFYRRLSAKPLNDGVTIIMRYTLRLLTIQQFERSTALICACEHLRKIHSIPGGEISIGLWIGSGMTPNRIHGDSGAAKILENLRNDPTKRISEGNPVQITTCPWCGETIDIDGYEIKDDSRLVIRCNRNFKCEYHTALPIYVVDDDIYRAKPTLLLSTIDKFARLAWEERSSALFGNEKIQPPELIIQDELHLISGPLGSLAGIYEIGVEYLCNQNGRYPKVIASTATVKNATEQIRNLYNKDSFQFPPSGINYSDSFFAVKASENDRPARTYIGLCETGGSLADLIIRVYANLMFTKTLFIKQGKDEQVIDQFATIVGYFNAIRNLGSSDNLINDRVRSIIDTLVKWKFKSESETADLVRNDIIIGIHDELTSRKTSKEIKDTLVNLDLPYTEHGCYSYVLASNMLSVGIDIDRLGVMTMYNQPKTNAEYIQATSRVGRRNPGVVLTLYNGSRSRDKSHYEQFGFYHKTFYQYVEATSVTPFSARAIEKALHCVFVMMLRLSEHILRGNNEAVNFRTDDDCVKKVTVFILERVKRINPEAVDVAERHLDTIIEEWDKLATDNPDTLVYDSRNNAQYCSLLVSAEQGSNIDFPTTLNSLRNVESSSNVFLSRRDKYGKT